jgi:hypothetical protein
LSSSKHIILFLAANPLGTTELALDEKARAIREKPDSTGHPNEFVTRWAMRPLDPLGELRMLMPTIARFSRYGCR